MKRPAMRYFILAFFLFGLLNNSFADDKALYQYDSASVEGTGKVYMGREIAHIMGYQGAAWLERENREKEERTDVLIKSLNL